MFTTLKYIARSRTDLWVDYYFRRSTDIGVVAQCSGSRTDPIMETVEEFFFFLPSCWFIVVNLLYSRFCFRISITQLRYDIIRKQRVKYVVIINV